MYDFTSIYSPIPPFFHLFNSWVKQVTQKSKLQVNYIVNYYQADINKNYNKIAGK